MKRLSSLRNRLRGFFSRYFVETACVVSLLLFAFSFLSPSYESQMARRVRKVERAVHAREKTIGDYIHLALRAPDDACLDVDDLPPEMVLYKYNLDTLHSWINEFPIQDDASDSYPSAYRLGTLSEEDDLNAPLAHLRDEWQYVNLGPDRYLISKWYSLSRRTKIIAGINLRGLPTGDYIHPSEVTENPAAVVRSLEGIPLFSLVADGAAAFPSEGRPLKWLSFLFAALALCALHRQHRSWRSFAVAWGGLTLLRLAAAFLGAGSGRGDSLFSPILYADSTLFPSLGDFLLNNTYVALMAYLVYFSRFSILRAVERSGQRRKNAPLRIAALVSLGTGCLALAVYIFLTLRSLILNSSLVLEPFRINEFTLATLLSYLTFAMLVLALLLMIQLELLLTRRWRRVSLFSWRNILFAALAVALFFVVAETVFGVKREYEQNRVVTAKLAIGHDLPFELALRSAEQGISEDPFLGMLVGARASDLLGNRLVDRYLSKEWLDRYRISIAICAPTDRWVDDPHPDPVSCFAFYQEMISLRGTRLDRSAHFYQINNYDGKLTYLGQFQYGDRGGPSRLRLYVLFTSKFRITDAASGPLPDHYSYACYNERRLVASEGSFRYPVVLPEEYPSGYSMVSRNGCVHFINRYGEADATMVSRGSRPWLPYLVSFSYLLIFFALFLILFTARDRRGRFLDLPKHSINRKITLLTTGVMLVSLAAIGSTAVFYNARYRNNANDAFMEERISAIQAALSEPCAYASPRDALTSAAFTEAVQRMAAMTRIDINVYDTGGSLVCSTLQEDASRRAARHRLHHHAFHEIVHLHATRYSEVMEEEGRSYYSIFAPLFNVSGDLVGVVNVPYRSRVAAAVTGRTLAMLLNLYLVLFIAALIIGVLLANSISRPIRELRDRMQATTASAGRLAHIPYKNTRDELSVLVQSYNDMVDALEESTRQLAQSEREQAWKEMARRIAHEIKNALTPMRLSIQHLIRLKQRNIPGWEEKVEQIGGSLISQIDVLAETASEFSAIARTADDVTGEVDLNALLREQMIIFDNRDNIELKYRCGVANPVISGRRKQLSRVFTNLITNAIQAIEESRGNGRIDLSLQAEEAEGRPCYVICVEDDGPGVPPENLDRIFTSHFTTRSSGSGLGLSICKGIVEQSGGTISCSRSQRLGGACFTVRLYAGE